MCDITFFHVKGGMGRCPEETVVRAWPVPGVTKLDEGELAVLRISSSTGVVPTVPSRDLFRRMASHVI